MCGRAFNQEPTDNSVDMLIVRIDDDGNQQWHTNIGFENSVDVLFSVINTDLGSFMCGGKAEPFPVEDNVSQTIAVHLDADGEQIWLNRFAQGEIHAVIELKSGEFIGAGWSNRRGYLVCFDIDGNVIWENLYGNRNSQYFYTMRETQGGIVVGGRSNRAAWVVKVSFNGELIWSREHQLEQFNWLINMTSSREGGFAFSGHSLLSEGRGLHLLLMKVDDNGDLEWHRIHQFDQDHVYETGPGLTQMNENGFTIVGRYAGGNWNQPSHPYAVRVNSQGAERWRVIYDMEDFESLNNINGEFWHVTAANDGSLIAAGQVHHLDESENGLVMKLEPDILEPMFLHWEPEDTLLEVLEGDTINFLVRAVDQQGDEMSYLWIMGEDTLSTDSTTTVIFDEMGEFEVQCQVSDGEFTSAITWYITVDDFVIRDYSPDETELAVRRGLELEFSLVAEALAEPEITYEWLLFDRNNQRQELGNEQGITTHFEMTGVHRLEGWALHGEDAKSVVWTIEAHSIVWWWWPHEFELSVRQDTTMVFEVFPFNEESDSLEYAWYLNNEALDCDTSLIEISFPEIGTCEITAHAQEGIEADTIRWTVEVIERSFTTDETDLTDLPTSPVLYPATPNPFNSSVKLSMCLPHADRVLLAVFDVNGREVSRLVDWNVGAGNQSFVWNASGFPAGVYVVRMDVGDVSEIRKVVLVR